MKKFMLLVAVIFAGSLGFSQNVAVPNAVKATFAKMFPHIEVPGWGQEDNGNIWAAEFTKDGQKYLANFSPEGAWLKTEHKLFEKEIPAVVKKSIAKAFKAYKLNSVVIGETPEDNTYMCAVEVDDQGKKTIYEVLMTEKGEIFKNVVVSEANDGEAENIDD